jgi:CHC2 zinc finger/Toprim domain
VATKARVAKQFIEIKKAKAAVDEPASTKAAPVLEVPEPAPWLVPEPLPEPAVLPQQRMPRPVHALGADVTDGREKAELIGWIVTNTKFTLEGDGLSGLPVGALQGIKNRHNGASNGAGDGFGFGLSLSDYPSLTSIVAVGDSGKIECPFHPDSTPSCHIYPDHYHCFGCGAHGDALDWVMKTEGLDRAQAKAKLADWQGPIAPLSNGAAMRTPEETLEFAHELWDAAKPIGGTLAMRYLVEVRNIAVDMLHPDLPLRFHPSCAFGPGNRVPCMLALFRDVETDAPAGIHRIALTPDLFRGAKVQRMTLGRWPRPRAVKLWPAKSLLFVGEGIETVLAAATRLEDERGEPMQPAWAAVSGQGLCKFPVVTGVDRLVLLVDNDSNGVGQAKANECSQRWSSAGRKVRKLMPQKPDTDFNTFVMEHCKWAR